MTEDPQNTRQQKDAARQREARQILDRVNREGEALGTSSFSRAANLETAADKAAETLGITKKKDDPIEFWGILIGRGAGAIFAIILVIWLFNHFTR